MLHLNCSALPLGVHEQQCSHPEAAKSCLKTILDSLIPSSWQEWQSEPSAMTLRQHSQMECNTCDDRAEESTPQDTLFGNHRLGAVLNIVVFLSLDPNRFPQARIVHNNLHSNIVKCP